ncbi:hypothetical protein [Phnomibacter ginsenosidimutans]|uniref:AAA family ATPase n=1 Tax=Phnomibacter ginsenosidimutans TaxID=2676868 RepID=A0A6I6GGD4_9BACT|nr:hypothetical protein [Phnomibacter ginsenosidimutans]QGW26718.1 hypothetical protein GLV81_00105 [Phnomibacter ginsenosidimutans]
MMNHSTSQVFSDLQHENTPVIASFQDSANLNQLCREIQMPANVRQLFETQRQLREKVVSKLTAPQPILFQGDQAILFPNTIMVVQGQSGVHKSRVAEHICSTFISQRPQVSHLGFQCSKEESFHVILADTERNLDYQLPHAIQQILHFAGIQAANPESLPSNFDFISLLEIPRDERFASLEQYITEKRATISGHLLVVLDVVTDCVKDFNRPEHSLELIDLMNRMINKSKCSFICVIHENPGSEKARGHLGTEIMNKASTVLQVGFMKQDNKLTDVIEIKFLKCRSTKRPDSLFARYKDEIKTIALIPEDELADYRQLSAKVSAIDETVSVLEECFTERQTIPYQELIQHVESTLCVRKDAARKRLEDVCRKERPICIQHLTYKLVKKKTETGPAYTIIPLT